MPAGEAATRAWLVSPNPVCMMKPQPLAAGLVILLLPVLPVMPSPIGTAFTYQGQLNDDGVPAHGSYDLEFTLYDEGSGGSAVAGPLTNSLVALSSGRFTVTLDFGEGAFSGDVRWLEIGVRSEGGGEFTRLSPRQPLLPSPYACFASNAGVASRSGSADTADTADTAAAFTGPLAGDVTGLQSATVVTYVGGQNAVDLAAAAVAANAACSTDTPATIVKRDGAGGFSAGAITAETFVGGGSGLTDLDAAALTGGSVDDARLSANVARLDADQVFIGSNRFSGVVQLAHPANTLTGMFSGIGSELTALNPAHLTTGTAAIDISGNAATATTASRAESVSDNAVTAAGIAPGQVVKSLNGLRDSVTLAAGANLTLTPSGQTLTLATPADWHLTGNSGTTAGTHFLGTADNQPLELKVHSSRALRLEPNAAQAPNVIAGARHNAVGAGVVGATIAGGGAANYDGGQSFTNQIFANFGVIGGGSRHLVAPGANSSVIAGGYLNAIGSNANSSVIGGGRYHDIGLGSTDAVIGGGNNNTIEASAFSATIVGGRHNAIGEYSSYATIGGGTNNTIERRSYSATIAGGRHNAIGEYSSYATIGGGTNNTLTPNSAESTIAGGMLNTMDRSRGGAIGGGKGNHIATSSAFSTIAGGWYNHVSAGSLYGAIGGGREHTITRGSDYATIPGGRGNVATNYAFAAGYHARAIHTGSLVWSDGRGTDTSSVNSNSVTLRASGGYRFFTGMGTAGAQLSPGATAWSALSDRRVKKGVQALDCRAVLDKLLNVPVLAWHYDWESIETAPHLGPMAQDFKAAFYPGRDDTTLSTLELDGVALAAIQGLNQKVDDRSREFEVRSQKLEAENAALQERLAHLERLVQQLAR